jgi:hypothetical protein
MHFAKIFEIKISHEYYDKKDCKDFILAPSEETSELLNRSGLKFRRTDTGCFVGAEVEEEDILDSGKYKLKIGIDDDVKFVFMMRLANQYFLNFTDLPIDKDYNKVYYFNNITKNITASRFAGEQDRIKLLTKINNYEAQSDNPQKVSYYYTTNRNKPMINENVSPVQNAADGKYYIQYQSDLRNCPPGEYEFQVNGALKDIFYADSLLYGEGIFGIIEILNRKTNPDRRFIDDNEILVFDDDQLKVKTYNIQFNKRKVKWHYIIEKKKNAGLVSLKILNNSQEVAADNSGGSEVTLVPKEPGGNDSDFEFNEFPSEKLILKSYDATTNININLPCASIQSLKKSGNDYFSEIYVTI